MTAVLFGITLVASAGVGAVNMITAEPIAQAEQAAKGWFRELEVAYEGRLLPTEIAAGWSDDSPVKFLPVYRDRYEIETEHICRRWSKDAFDGTRIDLLIRGNGWQIVIENKIRSEVATIKRHTQLDNYRRYVEKTMPDDYDRTLFILLSHRDNSAYCGDCWRYANYSYVFNSLIAAPTDPIIENYLATLFRLLSPGWETPDSQQGRMLSSLKRFYRKNILKLQYYE